MYKTPAEESLQKQAQTHYVSPYNIGMIHLALGDKETARTLSRNR